jgi:hypothetical protein
MKGAGIRMTDEKKGDGFRFLTPIEILPTSKRERSSFYDQIIAEFIESGLKYAMVKEIDKKPISIATGLRGILRKRNIKNVVVCMIKNRVYLKKLG